LNPLPPAGAAGSSPNAACMIGLVSLCAMVHLVVQPGIYSVPCWPVLQHMLVSPQLVEHAALNSKVPAQPTTMLSTDKIFVDIYFSPFFSLFLQVEKLNAILIRFPT